MKDKVRKIENMLNIKIDNVKKVDVFNTTYEDKEFINSFLNMELEADKIEIQISYSLDYDLELIFYNDILVRIQHFNNTETFMDQIKYNKFDNVFLESKLLEHYINKTCDFISFGGIVDIFGLLKHYVMKEFLAVRTIHYDKLDLLFELGRDIVYKTINKIDDEMDYIIAENDYLYEGVE